MPTMQVKRAEELRGEAAKALADARKIKDASDKEERSLTGEEWEKVNRLLDASDAKKREAEMEERMAGLDAGITPEERGQRLPEAVDEDASEEEREAVGIAETPEYREAFYRYIRAGDDGLNYEQRNTLMEVRALTEGTDSDGGYLAPPQLAAGVEREALDMEQLAPRMNTINATVRAIRQVRGEDSITFQWMGQVGEGRRKPEDSPTFGQVQIDAHTLAVIVRISDELLEDATFDLENYVAGLAAEAKVEGEEAAFVAGTGQGQPWGILTRLDEEAGAPHRYTTQPATAEELIAGDDFVRALYALAPRYRRNATWVLGTQAILAARLLKAHDRQYIWQPGLQAGQPDTILGKPVVEAVHEAVDNPIASGNDCGMVGDLRRYTVLRRLQLQVKRLEELYAATDEIGLRFRARTGGDVQHTRAFRSIRIGAAEAE